MENLDIKRIECEGFEIAAIVDAKGYAEHPIYYPANFLIYVDQGTLSLDIDGKIYKIHENEFCLVRKYTYGKFFKTWEENQNGFSEQVFILRDEFIKDVIKNFKVPDRIMPSTAPLIKLPAVPLLKGLMKSVEEYVTGQVQIDRALMRLKTMEALYALTKDKPELIHVFNQFSESARADLVQFIEHNYTHNLSLNQLAEMSGRSLSTFNREFRKEFNASPHKWIKQKRLELAKKLMLQTGRKASDVYLQVGFEDLAHFSKSFKQHFGQNPSEIIG
ncbi:helix-turn-helix domain-containing protein [Marinifilum sp.]|uniref:helix-turn-helix domain-containing protein n=1 Tax=Marinifilum sp. TaxID=2033137 RepID=UPI003BA949D5